MYSRQVGCGPGSLVKFFRGSGYNELPGLTLITSKFYPQSAFTYFMFFSEHIRDECVYWAIRTECSNIIRDNFSKLC